MNVFISQPMIGLTNDELKKYRSKVLDMIQIMRGKINEENKD